LRAINTFIGLIVVTGVARFALTVAGFPNEVVKFASMSVVILAATIYFGVTLRTHKERLKTSYLLILPYMIVEVAALGYTWGTGRQTIFHAEEYSFGFGIAGHTIGHFVGGLTWEPLMVFVAMEIVSFAYTRGRRLLYANT
jgi:hypothetical protein